jgi:hypothetical protein
MLGWAPAPTTREGRAQPPRHGLTGARRVAGCGLISRRPPG